MNIWIILVCIVLALVAVEFIRHYFVKYAIYLILIVIILFVALNYMSINNVIDADSEILATGFSIFEKISDFTEDFGISSFESNIGVNTYNPREMFINNI